MTRKIPKNFLQKFYAGLQQVKKLASSLAGVFSTTGHSLPICSSRVNLTLTRTHDTQDIDIYYSYHLRRHPSWRREILGFFFYFAVQRDSQEYLPKRATTITTDKSECVLFILTYNQALRSISPIIRKLSCHPIISTRYSSLHKWLPSDAAKTSPTFLCEWTYVTLHKTTYPTTPEVFAMRQSLFNVPRSRRVEDPLAKRAIKNESVASCHEWGESGKSQRSPKNHGKIRVIASKKKSTTLVIFYSLDQIITSQNECVCTPSLN